MSFITETVESDDLIGRDRYILNKQKFDQISCLIQILREKEAALVAVTGQESVYGQMEMRNLEEWARNRGEASSSGAASLSGAAASSSGATGSSDASSSDYPAP